MPVRVPRVRKMPAQLLEGRKRDHLLGARVRRLWRKLGPPNPFRLERCGPADTAKKFRAAWFLVRGAGHRNRRGERLARIVSEPDWLATNALVHITMAAPTEMTWLNFGDAEQVAVREAIVKAHSISGTW
jgi:hypothetical protein